MFTHLSAWCHLTLCMYTNHKKYTDFFRHLYIFFCIFLMPSMFAEEKNAKTKKLSLKVSGIKRV